jgi:hypothetical protein
MVSLWSVQVPGIWGVRFMAAFYTNDMVTEMPIEMGTPTQAVRANGAKFQIIICPDESAGVSWAT